MLPYELRLTFKPRVSPKKAGFFVYHPPDGKVSKAQGTFNAMDVTQRKITLLDIPTLSQEEKSNFIIALQNMKQAIETVLTAAMQPATEEPKPSKNLA